VVCAPPADQLVGIPVRAVVAGRIRVAQGEVGAVELRPGPRAAGGAALAPFEAAVAIGVEAVRRDAELPLYRFMLEGVGAPAALDEGVVVGRPRRHAHAPI